MLNIVNQIMPKAYAQFGGSNSGVSSSNFSLGSFNFLNPLVNNDNTATTFNGYFGTIVGLILTIAAIVAFIFLLMAGFQYITAGGDTAKADTARKGIVNALVGILIILVSYVILRYVGTAVLGTGSR